MMPNVLKKAATDAKTELTDAGIKNIEDTYGILFGKEKAASKDVLQVTENIAIPCKNAKRNINILAVGPSGSGKTHNFMLPNLLKASGSYLAIDPSKALLTDSIDVLQENGYTIKIIDFENTKHSETYNPFVHFDTPAPLGVGVSMVIIRPILPVGKQILPLEHRH